MPESSEPVLIPGLDCLNHRRGEPVTWEHIDGAACFLARQDITAGSQVFNNYGAKSNEELIASYGFAQPDGPDDVLVLALRGADCDSPSMFYWQNSSEEPPKELLDALLAQAPQVNNDNPQVAALMRQAHSIEALEQYVRSRYLYFSQVQDEVDDTVSWLSEDGTDGVRCEVLSLITEYRNSTFQYLRQVNRDCYLVPCSGHKQDLTKF